MSQHPDVIVLGTGGVGSAALYHLASRGVRVLGLDQHPPAHDKGSSHGETRIIRKAYFEHADYVPLLHRAYQLWDDLQLRSDRRDLFERTGLLQIGPENGVVIDGVLTSAAKQGLQVQKLSAAESLYRFPQYAVPEDCVAAYEADAGFLRVEECVREHLRLAQQMGAELQTGVVVRDWHATADGVEVETSEGSFHAGALVITAGAWAPTLLASLGIPMKVLRKPLFWLESRGSAHLQDAGCPCFLYELPNGNFYGFPELVAGAGVKMACHSGGDLVVDPAAVDRQLDPQDLALVQSFAASCLPQVSGALVKESTCLYTMSPDEHFIVDHHPGHANVVFAAGLSGHGFKFASVLGEILADLALEQRTDLPAEFLSLSRFGVK